MKTVTIYGSSDDLVEVEGDVPGCDEYGTIGDPLFVELSNGAAFRVEYTDRGVWTVGQVAVGGSAADGTRATKEPYGEGDDPEPYTETVRVTGPVEWVEVWKTYPPTIREIDEKVGDYFQTAFEDGRHGFTEQDVWDLWAIVARAKRRTSSAAG